MKVNILDQNAAKVGQIELPAQFTEPIREDIIQRAVLANQSEKRQRFGTFPEAGKRASVFISKRRHHYRGCYGIGIARTPRKVISRRGTRFNWVGAFAPNTVKGRRAHPPKATKKWIKKINNKELNKAIRSALAASMNRESVAKRGHKVPEKYPFIIDESFENISKTKELIAALNALGFADELARARKKHIRAGRGKTRGRKYKRTVGALIVASQRCPLISTASNIPGVDAVELKEINVELLAPGAKPGRIVLFTEPALKKMQKENLFI